MSTMKVYIKGDLFEQDQCIEIHDAVQIQYRLQIRAGCNGNFGTVEGHAENVGGRQMYLQIREVESWGFVVDLMVRA